MMKTALDSENRNRMPHTSGSAPDRQECGA